MVAPDPAPTISIVTPCFQHGHFLERTLASVLAQNYPAIEYFIQDGGSDDETRDILERYANRVSGWASEPDNGQADAINRGFARTSGEIMGWLNSDDLLLPGSLAYVARYFATHPEVDLVYGNRILIDDRDGQIGTWILPPHNDFALTLADFVPQETLFWRRRLWQRSGAGLDPSFSYALDWDLLLRFRDAGANMVHLPRFLGAFRVHDSQKTSLAHPVGQREMSRLRERVHGRPFTTSELNALLRPYLRRHVVLHLRQRLVDRFSTNRTPVQMSESASQTECREPGQQRPTPERSVAPSLCQRILLERELDLPDRSPRGGRIDAPRARSEPGEDRKAKRLGSCLGRP